MRCVSTRVFPLPAPASMRSGPSVCSTASSWVGFNDSRSTGREYNSRHRPILQQILPPQPVQEYLHISTSLLHCRFRYHDFEALFLHRPKEDWRFVTAGICEDRLSAGRKQLRYEVGQGGCVLTFVEDVRGEDQVESSPTRYARLAPVESGLVVVRSKYFGALGKRKYGGQPDAAPQLDNARTPKVSFR